MTFTRRERLHWSLVLGFVSGTLEPTTFYHWLQPLYPWMESKAFRDFRTRKLSEWLAKTDG